MRAIVAFCGGVFVRVHIKRVVRAGLCAGFTADTSPVVEINNAVRTRVERGDGTNLDARRVGAMITAHHAEQTARVGKFAFFDVFHPRSIDADGNLMLGFAGDRAGVTADTLAVINDKTKVHIFRIKNCFLGNCVGFRPVLSSGKSILCKLIAVVLFLSKFVCFLEAHPFLSNFTR